MPATTFTHSDYYSASELRYQDWKHLSTNSASTIFSMYCAGIVIECMLRAYVTKYTNEFDSKHDLEKLFIKSQITHYLDENEKQKLSIAIKRAKEIWNNNLRYSSEKRMKRIIAHQIVKTKFLDINKYLTKYNHDFFEATELIFKTGQAKWT